MRFVLIIVVIFSFFVMDLEAQTEGAEDEKQSWEALLKKARAKTPVVPPENTQFYLNRQASGKKTKKLTDIEKNWKETLQKTGYKPEATEVEGLVITRYPNGSIQSERLFEKKLIKEMKWYSLEGVLIFKGRFEKGKLVHKKRYNAFTGELESEWP